MPYELTFELYQFQVRVVELSRDLRAPMLLEEVKFIGKIHFFHHLLLAKFRDCYDYPREILYSNAQPLDFRFGCKLLEHTGKHSGLHYRQVKATGVTTCPVQYDKLIQECQRVLCLESLLPRAIKNRAYPAPRKTVSNSAAWGVPKGRLGSHAGSCDAWPSTTAMGGVPNGAKCI